MLDLPVWFEPKMISFSYVQLKHFLLPNIFELRQGDFPPEPEEYKTHNKLGWVIKKRSSYIGSRSNQSFPVARFVRAAELAAEIDYRIESIKTYRIQIDNILVPISGDLVLNAFTENLPLNSDLLHEAHLMLEFISGWDRRSNFKDFRERIRRE